MAGRRAVLRSQQVRRAHLARDIACIHQLVSLLRLLRLQQRRVVVGGHLCRVLRKVKIGGVRVQQTRKILILMARRLFELVAETGRKGRRILLGLRKGIVRVGGRMLLLCGQIGLIHGIGIGAAG